MTKDENKKRIIVGVTGASGVELAVVVLRTLRAADCEIHLIVSEGAKLTWHMECDEDRCAPGSDVPGRETDAAGADQPAGSFAPGDMADSPVAATRTARPDATEASFSEVAGYPSALTSLADFVYGERELAAVISSGSFRTDGMIIVPCSMKTLAGVVSGYAENLIQRAADVCLKENRRVVLVPREMPLSRIHLRNLSAAAELGCVIVPPMLTFYSGQRTLEDQMVHIAGKVLMQFDLPCAHFRPWKGA